MRDLGTNLFLALLASAFASSCAVMARRGQQEGILRESNLTNLNPAPKAFDPPDHKEGDAPGIDSAYLQSQSDYHFTLGESYGLEGDSERAIEEFKITLAYDPNSVMVRLRLSIEYVRQGLLSEAIEHAEIGVKLDPQSTEGRLLLGGLYSSLKMYEESLSQYRAILLFDKKNIDARIYIGAILAEQKKYDEAIAQFESIYPYFEKSEKYKAHYYVGRIRSEQGGKKNLNLAEKAFSSALSLNPSDVESVLALSKVYEQQGKANPSLKLLESFQEKFGPNQRVAQQLSTLYLDQEQYDAAAKQLEFMEGFEPDDLSVKFRLGLLYVEKKNYLAAVEKFQRLLEIDPQADRPRFYLGAVLEELKRYDEAVEHFRQIPASSGFYSDAVIHAAYLSKLGGKYDAAIEIIESALQQRDDLPQFYAFYASLLDDKKAYEKAISMLTGAVAKFPKHTQLLFFLGSMQDRVGNTKQTIEAMRRVIDIDTNHVQALNYLAYTFAELNQNLEEAESLARKALGFEPKDGYVLDTLGWVLFKQGKVTEAIPLLEAAHKAKSTESIIAEHLGDAYYKYELVEKARKMYQKAVEIEVDGNKIEKIRKKIAGIDNKLESPNAETRQPASALDNRQ